MGLVARPGGHRTSPLHGSLPCALKDKPRNWDADQLGAKMTLDDSFWVPTLVSCSTGVHWDSGAQVRPHPHANAIIKKKVKVIQAVLLYLLLGC